MAEAHGAYSLNWKPRAAIGLPSHVKSRRNPRGVDEYSVALPVAHRAGIESCLRQNKKEIMVTFRVYGIPRPGGSKRAFVIKGTNRAIVTEDCKKSKDWRADVRHACQEVFNGPLLTGPLFMRIIFWIARPKGHYGSGKNANLLKLSAPVYPGVKPDTTKMIRSTEDALTKILWKDDTQVIMQVVIKKYTDDKPGADILVTEMTPEMEWKCLIV